MTGQQSLDFGRRLHGAVEIGMAYLLIPGEEHKQYAIEAMLTLLTGSVNVNEFRAKFNVERQWKNGTPK